MKSLFFIDSRIIFVRGIYNVNFKKIHLNQFIVFLLSIII